MKLDFNLNSAAATEFGVGRDDSPEKTFRLVPVDDDVQVALREMAAATRTAMDTMIGDSAKYEPSERYESCEYVYLPLDDELAQQLRFLHEAKNIPIDAAALADSSGIFCYFARITDKQGRRLTALRRATQFKGVLKSRLIRLATDALRMIEDKVFKLDNDFDLLIDGSNVHILRPSGFEFVGKLQEAVLAAAPANAKAIQHDLQFVEFTAIEQYASKHPRAARSWLSRQKKIGGLCRTQLQMRQRTRHQYGGLSGRLARYRHNRAVGMKPASLEAGTEIHHAEHLHAVGRDGVFLPYHANLSEAERFDQLLDDGNVGNGFVGCCGRRCRHAGQFFPRQLRAVGTQRHGWSRGWSRADNDPYWLVLPDNVCLLHRISSKNGKRKNSRRRDSPAALPLGCAAAGGSVPDSQRQVRLWDREIHELMGFRLPGLSRW
jgi:hypothetical protein